MTDDTPKPPADDQPAPPGEPSPAAPHSAEPGPAEPPTPATGGPAKSPLSEEEKAAKIAAARAKATAAKATEAQAEPKPSWEDKPVPPAHADAADDPDVAALAGAVPGSVLATDRYAGAVTVLVPRHAIVQVCRFLKDEQKFSFLVDLTAIDWPGRAEGRFDVVYWMHRFGDSKRLRLRVALPEGEPIASVTGVWKTANWMEREAYDMFGIIFSGHPGLERILTWEGFHGHPLRKDFPVQGIDTGAAIYPDVYPPGGGPVSKPDESTEKEAT